MPKDNKIALKEAKDHHKKKNFLTTIKICKKILKEDKGNYNALVLIAAAMIEVDEYKNEVPRMLKKAVKIQPDNPLAWRGLSAYYEAQEANADAWIELIPVYCKLLQLDGHSEKFEHYIKHSTEIVLKLNNDKLLTEVIKTFSSLVEENGTNIQQIKLIYECLISILTQCQNFSHQYTEILDRSFCYILNNDGDNNKQEFHKKYLKFLYKSEQYDKLLKEAIKMHNTYNQEIYPLEWICKVYSEVVITSGKCENFNISIYYETLIDHDSESILGYFAKGVHQYQQRNFIEARDILGHLVNAKPKWFHAWKLLAEINLKLYCWEGAEIAATHALKLLTEDRHNLRPRLNLIFLEALIKNSNTIKWKKAKEIFNELSDQSSASLLLKAQLLVNLNDDNAIQVLEQLERDSNSRMEAIIIKTVSLFNKKNLEEAADYIGSVLQSSEAWLILGKIHWEMADYGHSLMAFLKGIHADPYNWECFVYLGQYHREYTKDFERSRKCYQKALQINPNSDQAGIGLSLINRTLKNSEENIQFLKQLTSQDTGPKWALIQLGLQYLERNEPTEAILILRNSVKTDPNDHNCWECLADAYLARGAYTSSLRSYQRALEINPNSLYPMIQMSKIKLLIGEYDEAKMDFENVLIYHPDSVVALKGLAECCFNTGRKHAFQQRLSRARDDFQKAIDTLTKALILRNDFTCNWKLFGDICCNVAKLPEKYCFLDVNQDLVESQSSDSFVQIQIEEILNLATRCYCRALHHLKDVSLLWHDLAKCYLLQLHNVLKDGVEELVKKCLAAVKAAIKINPKTWLHWNLLGVICMSDAVQNYALAQHSFVMAIDQESNNAVPWTNLGLLYLLLEEPFRANEAFSWAQRVDPGFANSWIGQAIIAENVSQKDAIDLFRHSAELGYHHQAAIGYAHWVIKTILDPKLKHDSFYKYIIEKMFATTVATDVIHWYTVHYPKNPHALNAYGLLLERQRLYNSSAEAFFKALQHVTDNKKRDWILINLARVNLQLKNYKDSIDNCKNVKEASFTSHCQLALSLFKAENFKESYEAYETALHWLAENETNIAYVLCAMAAMAFMFQESNDAKTLLFQAIAIQPPIIPGLLALASLGMLDNDKNLTDLVLKELQANENHPVYRNDIAKLRAYSLLIQHDTEGAARVLSKCIHKYPDSSELWNTLAKTLLSMSDTAFSKCAEKALCLGRNLSTDYSAKITCMSSFSALIKSSPEVGLRSVLNTVHAFPGYAESWSNLIAALIPRWSKKSKFNAHWLMVLTSRVRNDFTCSRSMEQWLLKNEKKADDIAYC